jgi:hypothetical protein
MKVICSSETLVDTQWTTHRYIPEDGTQNESKLTFLKLLYASHDLINQVGAMLHMNMDIEQDE